MVTGIEITTSQSALTLAKAFLIAHPVGAAIVGGAAIGAGTYFLMNKFLNKKEPEKPVEA
ncbi:hypothetical protein QUF74_16010 [Candidatus Halobeggiatoa sp. HSG11]|nr:hypothetical protein [Candidatus Halobeggiatoa sp. HSG11]